MLLTGASSGGAMFLVGSIIGIGALIKNNFKH